jgi:hypothetical protein
MEGLTDSVSGGSATAIGDDAIAIHTRYLKPAVEGPSWRVRSRPWRVGAVLAAHATVLAVTGRTGLAAHLVEFAGMAVRGMPRFRPPGLTCMAVHGDGEPVDRRGDPRGISAGGEGAVGLTPAGMTAISDNSSSS